MNGGASLTIGVLEHNGTPVIALDGELDMSNVHLLKDTFAGLNGGPDFAIVDMTNLTFIDSAGLNAIAVYGRRALNRGIPLYIVGTRPSVRRLFAITRLDEHFALVDTLDETAR